MAVNRVAGELRIRGSVPDGLCFNFQATRQPTGEWWFLNNRDSRMDVSNRVKAKQQTYGIRDNFTVHGGGQTTEENMIQFSLNL